MFQWGEGVHTGSRYKFISCSAPAPLLPSNRCEKI